MNIITNITTGLVLSVIRITSNSLENNLKASDRNMELVDTWSWYIFNQCWIIVLKSFLKYFQNSLPEKRGKKILEKEALFRFIFDVIMIVHIVHKVQTEAFYLQFIDLIWSICMAQESWKYVFTSRTCFQSPWKGYVGASCLHIFIFKWVLLCDLWLGVLIFHKAQVSKH